MPLYVYRCAKDHLTEAIVKLDGRDAPERCERLYVENDRNVPCGRPLHRMLAAPAGFPGADAWRRR